MDDPIENRVRDRGFAEIVVPLLARQLTRDHRGAAAVTVFEHFEQVLALALFERRQSPIVEHEDIDAGQACEQRRVRAIACTSTRIALRRIDRARANEDREQSKRLLMRAIEIREKSLKKP